MHCTNILIARQFELHAQYSGTINERDSTLRNSNELVVIIILIYTNLRNYNL